MTDLRKKSNKHFEITKLTIEKFIDQYGEYIRNLVVESQGDVNATKELISKIILEVYLLKKADKYDDNSDNRVLIKELVNKHLETDSESPRNLLFSFKPLNSETKALNPVNFNPNTIETVLSQIGEPGRTLLKLSFHNRVSDEQVASHIHADSIEEMSAKRLRFLDKCVVLLSGNE